MAYLLNDRPVSCTYNLHSPTSFVSSQTILTHGLSVVDDHCVAVVTAPLNLSDFLYAIRLTVSHNSETDISLGEDWFKMCSDVIGGGSDEFPVSNSFDQHHGM